MLGDPLAKVFLNLKDNLTGNLVIYIISMVATVFRFHLFLVVQ